jgi:hypothetical protein
MEQPTQTFGEKAVGLSFNPSFDAQVDRVKRLYAEIIDEMHALRLASVSQEQKRHASIAITLAEDAQMRAVKAVTWRD